MVTNEPIRPERRKEDSFMIEIEKCLESIKTDVRGLPCRNVGEGCLQAEPITELKESMKQLGEAYQTCHNEKIQPLIQANLMLNEKQDQQQLTLDKIDSKIDHLSLEVRSNQLAHVKELADLKLSLVTQLTQIVTERTAVKTNTVEIRTVIAWGLGIIVSSIVIFNFLKSVL